MPRRGFIPKREVLPDPVYGTTVVTKLINQVMLDGKRGVAQAVCYDAFEMVANKTGKPEAVFTDEQLNRLGGNTQVTINGVPMDSAGQTADEILYQLRRVDRGKYAARR